ncbi:MAG TPA: hypothetical protein VFV38_11390 [Ktedonobacteraceae bacterium]|nr:hypothetical protein [Ktedonobacteraceae bacterium]
MPKLLRLRLCNIGPQRARMEHLILPFEDIITGQATHSLIFLRNGGGKSTLISLLLWLCCPDKPMPDKKDIHDFVLLWHSAIPMRTVLRMNARIADIDAQLTTLREEHEPLLHMVQASASTLVAALSARTISLRGEEQRLNLLSKGIAIIQAGRRIPEEVLGPDELYQVWQATFSC